MHCHTLTGTESYIGDLKPSNIMLERVEPSCRRVDGGP